MTKKNELDEKQLESVNGGNITKCNYMPIGRVICPCGCRKLYTHNFVNRIYKGDSLGTCSQGWEATYNGGKQVKFYNPTTTETKYADFEFDVEKHDDGRL